MHCQIDAWLERSDPLIRVIDTDTGWVILLLDSDQVHALIESGDLCPEDLADNTSTCTALNALMAEQAA
jgi:hypothetical protein